MNNDIASPPPHREPLRQTLSRTLTIALVIGAVLAQWPVGGTTARGTSGFMTRWGFATLLALWPSLGGHWVELFFLNILRPRLPATRPTQTAARIATWFIGGALLTLAMKLTALALFGGNGIATRIPTARLCLIGGLAFIAIELTVHLILRLRHLPSFYDPRA
jgi:hypothetical protein